ncbi:hypothetical protein ABMA27_003172 [Loxostege sticticalis]|uniref:Uncharacterized protein n=1 Tax=Loxostege sticticalis TaxID=481309 RepID=A0ABR3HS92_LOXSC
MENFIDKQYLVMLLFVLFSAFAYAAPNAESDKAPVTGCEENGDCLSTPQDCHEICGCDRSGLMAIYYNETTKSCVVSFKHLMIAEIKIYGADDEEDDEGSTITGGTMSNKIRIEAEKIFNTILISAVFFISCCAVCVISACCYCCRMTYTDYRLKSDVKALAKKLNRDGKLKRLCSRKQPQTQANQSCNIMCEEAGIFVV